MTATPCPHLVFGYRPCLRKHGHTGMHYGTFKD